MKKLLLTLLLFVLCFVSSSFAQETAPEKIYKLEGVLKDKNDAVIAGTRMLFIGNNTESVAISNADGEFTNDLQVGTYKVTINKDISSDFIAFIEIRENGINPNNIEFVIKTDSICCGQSPDKMFPKLLSFPKPAYPAAARAVRAIGEVTVLVKVGKEGKIISATATIGHPLLRKAAEQAAKQSLFEASENIDEREAKLTYVFLSDAEKNLRHYSNPYRVEIIAQAVGF